MPQSRAVPPHHTSIFNALDLHLRGLTILVTGEEAGDLTRVALSIPYLDRTVCTASDVSGLSDTHLARAQALSGRGPQALICAGMRCSLPITDPNDLLQRASQMSMVSN